MKNIIFTVGLLCSLPLFAQQQETSPEHDNEGNPQNELKEVVIHGNRIRIPFSQAARDIQVVTQEQIKMLPAKSINEVLSYISGVDVRQRGPFGTQTDISIDGGTSEQTIVLINGVKMIDAQTAHNMMNIPIPLSAIDHIEVLRGAAARVFGINALTGAINIVTKKERHSSITAIAQAGSSFKQKEEGDGSGIYAGGRAEVTANFGNENQSHLLSLAQTNYNGQRYNSASKNTRIFYNGEIDLDPNNKLQAMAGYADSRFGANGFYAAPGDSNSEELVTSSIFSLSSRHQWGDFMISPRISNRYGEDDYRYFKDDLSRGRSIHYTNALMLELNSSLQTNIGTFGFGWESRLETINSSNIGEHKRDNHGFYTELRSQLGEKLTGSAGVYANYNTVFGWQVYPGIDLAYEINGRWTLSTSIGSGQRIPSFTDLYLDQRPGNIGNELLQPEDAWNYEGNISYQKNALNLQVGYFYREITDFIDWVRENASEPYSPINFGDNTTQGIYARIQQNVYLKNNQSLGYRLSYNHLDPTIKSSDVIQSKYVLESLKHQFIAGISYQIDKLSLQVENRWLQRELADAYNITDLQVNYNWQNFLVFTEVTNIFDAEYTEAGAVPMPTRWFSLGLRYEWDKF
ncbi:TonB-dependent receptor [Salinimicrobium tongyeongense]|uniref:TonB-dependent receptor n=1 Tax=Salinimicrobium tongyeongense TaxID=2809707 RepID=A0ABY6NT09_9FLAO|nr:TonB-dependent receptor [Salinimicrobium tongyeongense]UZH56046.1 TonB-dependent receptor [Salinimicrobium tongyeongense]